MIHVLMLSAAALLFLIGLRLSALFSGSETGFYRTNVLRLSIDVNHGDAAARRILWLTRRPAQFVATILIGNNVANYLVTVALGLLADELSRSPSGALEVGLTLLAAPIIFVWGELVPKNLYFRAPMRFMRRNSRFLVAVFRLLAPLSVPLVLLQKLLQKLQKDARTPLNLLGRSHLMQLVTQGRQAGLLQEVQNTLFHGVLQVADKEVTRSMIPSERVLGVVDTTGRDALLQFARQYSLTEIAVCTDLGKKDWYGYVRVLEAALTDKPIRELVITMPRLLIGATNLEALLKLAEEDRRLGTVCDRSDRVVGVVTFSGLADQLVRPQPPGLTAPGDD